jgi:hypothetical protein
MMLAAANFTKDRRPARGGSISAGRWAASDGGGVGGRQELGGWTAAAGGERRQRATSNERRPEEHELGQRATFNEQRSGERRVAGGEQRRRATRWRATNCGQRGDARRRRAAWWRAAGDEQRAASREAAVHSGVPNKPMVLTATGVLWIARPAVAAAHRRAVGQTTGDARRASVHRRDAESAEARTVSATATGDVRKRTNWANAPRSTDNAVASGEWRVTATRVLRKPRTTGGERRGLCRHRTVRRRATTRRVTSQTPSGVATRRRTTSATTERRGDGRQATGVDFTCTRLKRRRRCDRTANEGHPPRGDKRRGTATGGDWRCATPQPPRACPTSR